MLELIYTSAPKGLLPGTKGFATVAMTTGMPPQLVQACEALSSYNHVFGLETKQYKNNPVALNHLRVRLGGKILNAISRTGATKADYSGRTNKISHHYLLDTNTGESLPEPGPVALISTLTFKETWTGDPTYLPEGQPPILPSLPQTPPTFHARHWPTRGLSTTLAARLAAAWQVNPTRPTFLTFNPNAGSNIYLLDLIGDAIKLLAPESRWNATFSTYTNSDLPGAECICRCVMSNSPGLALAQRVPDTLVIDTTTGQLSGGEYAAATAKDLEPAADGLALPPWADHSRRKDPSPIAQEETGVPSETPRTPLRLREKPTVVEPIQPKRKKQNLLWISGIAALVLTFITLVTFLSLNTSSGKQSKEPRQTRTPGVLPQTPVPGTNKQLTNATTVETGSKTTIPPTGPTNITLATTTTTAPSNSTSTPPVSPGILPPPPPERPTSQKPFTLCQPGKLNVTTGDVQSIVIVTPEGVTYRPVFTPPTTVSGSKQWKVLRKNGDTQELALFTPGTPSVWNSCITLYVETRHDRQIEIVAERPFPTTGHADLSNRELTVTLNDTPGLRDLTEWVLYKAPNLRITPHIEGLTCDLRPDMRNAKYMLRGTLPEHKVDEQAKKAQEDLVKWKGLATPLHLTKRPSATLPEAETTIRTYLSLVQKIAAPSGTLNDHGQKISARIKVLDDARNKAASQKDNQQLKAKGGVKKRDPKDEVKRIEEELVKDYQKDELGTWMSQDASDQIARLEEEVRKQEVTNPTNAEPTHPTGKVELQLGDRTVLQVTIDGAT